MIKKNDLRLRICVIVALMLFSVFYAFSFHRSKTEGVKMLVDTRVLDKFDLKLGVKSKINLGLDLKGGMYVLLRADTRGIASAKVGDALSGAIEKIRNRIDVYGVNEPSIQLQGNNTILVQVPGKLDPNVVKKLREVGKLEFKLVDANADNLAQAVSGQIPQGFELKQYNKDNILIEKETSLDGSTLLESFLGADQYGRSEVRLRFTSEGSKQFAKVTEANVGRQLAIVLDGKVMSAPVINEPILSGQAQISGSFSPEEARALISVLNSGALPVPLTLEEERSVGPLLGSDSIRRGVKSILFGAALVIVFMLGYYLVGGFIAVICLFLDLLFVLAGLHLFGATLTLPGIAGMILTLGMAVDANVLIFERIREELQSKKPLSVAAANGFDRAKRTIFDANITTLIAAVFLYFFGTGPIRGFAITLSLGIIASIFTAVFVGRTLFAILINLKLKKFTMLRFVPDSHINFIKIRNFCFILSLVAVGLGTHNFYSQSEEIYGIDFKGGQNLEYRIIPEVSVDVVRNLLSKEGLTDLVIQEFTDIDGGILIKSSKVVDEQVETTLKQNFDNVESLRVTTVGPAVGKILKKKALLAFILSI
ncbi:MAG: protein translocase subunit SecD, partial [Candidatus Omnitrophica bacterium]|nr:protein translocase subunit SecD [Candidatus Omnitrophota bacterium]